MRLKISNVCVLLYIVSSFLDSNKSPVARTYNSQTNKIQIYKYVNIQICNRYAPGLSSTLRFHQEDESTVYLSSHASNKGDGHVDPSNHKYRDMVRQLWNRCVVDGDGGGSILALHLLCRVDKVDLHDMRALSEIVLRKYIPRTHTPTPKSAGSGSSGSSGASAGAGNSGGNVLAKGAMASHDNNTTGNGNNNEDEDNAYIEKMRIDKNKFILAYSELLLDKGHVHGSRVSERAQAYGIIADLFMRNEDPKGLSQVSQV